jgi:antitoxin VapB
MNGDCQVARIPQELRLDATQVEIRRAAKGDLVTRPLPVDRGAALLEALQGFDDDFIAALEASRADDANQPPQEREPL